MRQRTAIDGTGRPRRGERGAVLPVALVFMTITLAVAAYTLGLARELIASAELLSDKLQAKLAAESAVDRAEYLLATGRIGRRHVRLVRSASGEAWPERLPLDGTPSRLLWVETVFQDAGGKLAVCGLQARQLRLVLQAAGLDTGAARVVVDSYLDWLDSDREPRLNGAETPYYRNMLGRAHGSRDSWLIQDPEELRLLRGMDRVADWPALKRVFTIDMSAPVNINTIPRENLAALLGITEVQAAQLAALRETKGALVEEDWRRLLSGDFRLGPEMVQPFASLTVELTATARVGGAREVARAVFDCRPGERAPITVIHYEP